MSTKKKVIIGVLVLFALIVLYNRTVGAPKSVTGSLGSYGYTCKDGFGFTMTPAPDTTSILLAPRTGGDFLKENSLVYVPVKTGAEFEGNGITFTAKGESVTLTTSGTTTTCAPDQVKDQAPFNFGD